MPLLRFVIAERQQRRRAGRDLGRRRDALRRRHGQFDNLPRGGDLLGQPVEVAARSRPASNRSRRSLFFQLLERLSARADSPGLRASNWRITSRAFSRSPMRSHVRERFRYSISSSGATWMPYSKGRDGVVGLAGIHVEHGEVVDGRSVVAADRRWPARTDGALRPSGLPWRAAVRVCWRRRHYADRRPAHAGTGARPRRRCPAFPASAPAFTSA